MSYKVLIHNFFNENVIKVSEYTKITVVYMEAQIKHQNNNKASYFIPIARKSFKRMVMPKRVRRTEPVAMETRTLVSKIFRRLRADAILLVAEGGVSRNVRRNSVQKTFHCLGVVLMLRRVEHFEETGPACNLDVVRIAANLHL